MSFVMFPVFPAALAPNYRRRCKAHLNCELAANKTRRAWFQAPGCFHFTGGALRMPHLIREDNSCFGAVTRFLACPLAVFATAFAVTAASCSRAWRRWRLAFIATAFSPARAESFSSRQKAEIEAIIKDYLLQKPEILREAIDVLEAREKAAETKAREESRVGPLPVRF